MQAPFPLLLPLSRRWPPLAAPPAYSPLRPQPSLAWLQPYQQRPSRQQPSSQQRPSQRQQPAQRQQLAQRPPAAPLPHAPLRLAVRPLPPLPLPALLLQPRPSQQTPTKEPHAAIVSPRLADECGSRWRHAGSEHLFSFCLCSGIGLGLLCCGFLSCATLGCCDLISGGIQHGLFLCCYFRCVRLWCSVGCVFLGRPRSLEHCFPLRAKGGGSDGVFVIRKVKNRLMG